MKYIARDRDNEYTIEADHIVVNETNVTFVKDGKAIGFVHTAWSVIPAK